jgi:hypothetical protein
LSNLPTDAAERKEMPIARGVLGYFPDAIAEVAHVSFVGNQQHNPGQPMHWAKGKSTDHADCLVRHLIEAGTIDTDGLRHSAKVAWRALALLQTEIDNETINSPSDIDIPPLVGPERFAHACPDIDQGADDSHMVYAEEVPVPVYKTALLEECEPGPGCRHDRPGRRADDEVDWSAGGRAGFDVV